MFTVSGKATQIECFIYILFNDSKMIALNVYIHLVFKWNLIEIRTVSDHLWEKRKKCFIFNRKL